MAKLLTALLPSMRTHTPLSKSRNSLPMPPCLPLTPPLPTGDLLWMLTSRQGCGQISWWLLNPSWKGTTHRKGRFRTSAHGVQNALPKERWQTDRQQQVGVTQRNRPAQTEVALGRRRAQGQPDMEIPEAGSTCPEVAALGQTSGGSGVTEVRVIGANSAKHRSGRALRNQSHFPRKPTFPQEVTHCCFGGLITPSRASKPE